MTRSEISSLQQASTPILVLETQEERRAINLLKGIALGMGIPVATWSVLMEEKINAIRQWARGRTVSVD